MGYITEVGDPLRDLVSLSWRRRGGRKVWPSTETERVLRVKNCRVIHPTQRNNLRDCTGARVSDIKPRGAGKHPRVSEGSLWSIANVSGSPGPKFSNPV